MITELRFPCSFPAVNAHLNVHLLLASLGSVSAGSAPREVCKSVWALRQSDFSQKHKKPFKMQLPTWWPIHLLPLRLHCERRFHEHRTVFFWILRLLFLCYFLMSGYISISSLKTAKQSAPCKMNGQLRMLWTRGSFVKHPGKTRLYWGRDETKNQVRKWKLSESCWVIARIIHSKSCSGRIWQKWNITTKHTKKIQSIRE